MLLSDDKRELFTEAVSRIVTALSPEKIYLFGSHVWGEPTPDSDIDLLVIVEDSGQPAFKRSQEAYRALRGISIPIEVVVRTRAEVERSMNVASSLARKVLSQGKLVYG